MINVYLCSDTAKMPKLGSEGAAGYDIYSDENDFVLHPGERKAVKTGVTLEMWPSIVCEIRPRSGLAVEHGIDVLAGIVDSDYRGEIKVVLINLGSSSVIFNRDKPIAQLLFKPVLHGVNLAAGRISETVRGANGFGSTDK